MNSYIEGLNPIYTRFSDHLRKIRSGDGLIEDFTQLSRKLTMEGIIISGLTDAISDYEYHYNEDTCTCIHVL